MGETQKVNESNVVNSVSKGLLSQNPHHANIPDAISNEVG